MSESDNKFQLNKAIHALQKAAEDYGPEWVESATCQTALREVYGLAKRLAGPNAARALKLQGFQHAIWINQFAGGGNGMAAWNKQAIAELARMAEPEEKRAERDADNRLSDLQDRIHGEVLDAETPLSDLMTLLVTSKEVEIRIVR